MFAQERRKAIHDLLSAQGRLTVGELQDALDASPATIRRDLAELEREGQVVRTHGGIIHPSTLQGEPVFQQRVNVAAAAKRAIAGAAAAEVPERATLFIDTGTTALSLAALLVARGGLTIFTNSIPVLALARSDGAHVVGLGGDVRIPSQSLCGAAALAWLDRLRFDVAFMGTSGIDPEGGATITSLEECAMKQGAIARAGRTVLLADAGKWSSPAAIAYAGWGAFDLWITDARPGRADATRLRAAGVEIVRVKTDA
ncbi:MAG: DeoR/GlpR family DNA-binding transcription regulator [Spirochaetota bacterium]